HGSVLGFYVGSVIVCGIGGAVAGARFKNDTSARTVFSETAGAVTAVSATIGLSGFGVMSPAGGAATGGILGFLACGLPAGLAAVGIHSLNGVAGGEHSFPNIDPGQNSSPAITENNAKRDVEKKQPSSLQSEDTSVLIST